MGSLRVVLVEDHTLMRAGIRALLQLLPDVEVVGEADNGPDAISLVSTTRPDLMLLDITLPGITGRDVFDELSRIRPDVKVILCTAYSQETATAEFGERKISGFIRKPYRTDDLVKLLDECAEV